MKATLLRERCAQGSLPGTWAAIRCRISRVWLSALRLRFGFDAWHAGASYSCRPYKRVVVELANALRPALAVEVGCGLGDIISRVAAVERIGIDADPRVIRAAQFLHPRGRWIHGDGRRTLHLVPPNRQIDCLIMVNWIHTLSPAEVAALLLPLLPVTRFLILDAIDAGALGTYRYRHDFGLLAGRARRLSATRLRGEPRTLVVFEVLP